MRPAQVIAERFEIERLAGSGGMGAVYRAIDKVEGGVVALKVLHGTGEEHADRFVREARALAELRHPGIVRYVAHGRTQQGELYLAMEWLDGEDLAKRLGRAGLTVAESIQVVSRAAEALAVAHAHGLVHRDVKPSNLFLAGADLARVKLLDFGVVRLQSASLAQTRTGMMLGTPGYMAPEQARGAKDIDARADVFALGCVLFECLTGRPPFTGEHAMAVLAKIILDEAPRVADLKKDVPPALDDLVARMLAKEPEERPEDAAAVASELAGLGSVGGSEQAPAAEHKAMLTIGEQRLVCAVLAGAAVATDAEAATLTPDVDQAQREPLKAVAVPFQARLEWLANGSIVATLSGQGSATDQAAQAARFALALRGVLADAPIALATGRAVVADRWPMGEVIDRAARLLSEAERAAAPAGRPRPVAIDEVTAGLLDARFDVSAALPDPGLTFGAKLPVRRELHGERAPSTVLVDAGRTLLGKATPFVGRDRELLTLEATFAECAGEPVARAVVVTGAPGVGKSRLRRELLQRLKGRDDAEGLAVFTGRGDPMSAGSPFGLLAQVVRDAAGIAPGAPLADRQARLFARVSLHVPEAERARVTTFLGELCGTPIAEASEPDNDVTVQLRAARQDAMLMGDQMRRAFEDWLAAECAAHPTMLVLEDLHFGDLPSVKFIDAALRTAADKPLFVLALARPEIDDLFPRLWAERNAQEVRLGELSRKACEKLAQKVLGPGAAVDTLVERAAGNAFFLEELIRAAADGAGDALPATVLAVVQSRLEALPAEARRVLRAGSVYGMRFTRAGCTALLGGAERTGMIDEWLVDLAGREILTPQGERFTFRHAPWREAAYAMLTEHDRTLGHRLAGMWLEQAGELDPMVLAGHYERGGEPVRAVRWILRGAEQALNGNDFAAAVERAGRGLAMQGAPAELHMIKAEAHRWRGESAEAERAALEAMRQLPRGSAPWCAAAGEAALSSGRLGHVDALAGLLTSLPPLMADSPPLLAVAWGRVAQQLLYAGRRVLVDAPFRRLLEVVDDVTTRDPPSGARLQIALANQALFDGDTHAYLLRNEAASRAYAQAGDLRNGCFVGVSVGFAYIELGAYGAAKAVLRDTLVSATRMGLPAVITLAKHNLGLALARDGAIDAGRAAESEAAQGAAAAGDKRMEGLSRHYLATILFLAGDPGGAEREARAAVALLAANPPLRAHALATLAQILLARGAPEAAATAREAHALLDQLGGLQEGEALVRLVHAEALAAGGDLPGARATIATAQARLLERAAKIGDPAWRDSFLANVPEHARTLQLHRAWQ